MFRRRSHAILTGLATGMVMLLTSCILIVPDTRSKQPLRVELPMPAKNPTVSYMTVDLEDLSCDQLRVALNALPTGRRSWRARGNHMQSSPGEWQMRRRVREIENAIAARCSPVVEIPEGL